MLHPRLVTQTSPDPLILFGSIKDLLLLNNESDRHTSVLEDLLSIIFLDKVSSGQMT